MDLSLSPEPKAVPRKGRRAAGATGSSNDNLIGNMVESSDSVDIHEEPVAPPRSRKTGVWGDENFKSAKPKKSPENFIEIERFNSPERGKDSEDDIPLIPDLDEVTDDYELHDITMLTSNRITSLAELDSDLRKKMALNILEDINLGKLTRFLYAEDDLKESDMPWSWDLLFTEVSSELRSEREVKIGS